MNVTNIRNAESTPSATWIPNSFMGVISEATLDRKPTMVVVVASSNELNARDIQQHLQQFVESGHISKWAVPEHITLVDDIPKTSVGKINKKVIRASLAG